jgi:anti-sigma factor RsiW
MMHPTPERLEAYVEESLDVAERAVLASHLLACPRCQGEVEEWRTIFVALRDLPQLAPSAGFADRVMADVRVHQPWTVRVLAALERLLPRSSTGWALAAAFVMLPALGLAGLLAWLLTRPGVTADALLVFVGTQLRAGAAAAGDWVLSTVLTNQATVALLELGRAVLDTGGIAGVGMAAAGFGALVALSLWVLYQNLFHTPTRETTHASFGH